MKKPTEHGNRGCGTRDLDAMFVGGIVIVVLFCLLALSELVP